jgi:hypothetical protein
LFKKNEFKGFKEKNKTTAKNYHLSVGEKLKVLEVRKESLRKNPKASLVDIIKAFLYDRFWLIKILGYFYFAG